MSDMTPVEAMEYFSEGLKKAASRARQLGRLQKNSNWTKVANNLDNLRLTGEAMFKSKAMSRQETLALLDQRVKTLKV